nr:cell division protein FtsZ [Candidatus Nardonella dryophthoridicola]
MKKLSIENKIQIGKNITKGFGVGSNPDIGKISAEEDKDILKNIIKDTDILFILAGMGGGTGTGASPVIAEISKELGILTIAIVTKPFNFEGNKRLLYANKGINLLSKYVDSLIIIPNDKLLKVFNYKISLIEAFSYANNIFKNAIQGISELIIKPGLINVDFADIKTIMNESGYSIIGVGISSGEKRAEESIKMAISSPLLENINLSNSKGILINISANYDLRLDEFELIGNEIKKITSNNSTIVIGTTIDENMDNSIKITILATGINYENLSDIDYINNKNIFNNINEKYNKNNIKYKNINNEEYINIPSF